MDIHRNTIIARSLSLFMLLGGICAFVMGCSKPDNGALIQAIAEASNYLSKQVQSDGMFIYRKNMDPDVRVNKRYNILRHAGTVYSLCMSYEMNPDEELKQTIENAGRYLLKDAMRSVVGQEDMKAIWSIPEVNNTSKPLQAKLGGTGLGLVALLSVDKINPNSISLSDLRALGNFIVYMQKEDGDFYFKYFHSHAKRDDSWRSLYYPGEAALGLAMLYQKDKQDIWINTAARSLAYLAKTRKGQKSVPADHWALLATSKILSTDYNNDSIISREDLIFHAVQICEKMIKSQVKNNADELLNGCFTKNGSTTPTATRLEGLLAVLTFLPEDHEIYDSIVSAVELGIQFLINAQVKEGEFKGAIPNIIQLNNTRSASRSNSTEVRIDYVQHALSAFIQYYEWSK